MGHAGAAPADDPAHRRLAAGRVTAAFWTIHGALGPIGAARLTAAVERFGVRGPLLVVCGLFALVSLVALATPIRQRHPERAAAVVS